MAATTFAALAAQAGTAYDRTVIYHQFLRADEAFRNLPLVMTSGKGKEFRQTMVDSSDTAVFGGYQDDFASTAVAFRDYAGFLARIMDQKPVDAPVGAFMDPQNVDLSFLDVHKKNTIEAVCRKFRDKYILGQPGTVAIGADWGTAGLTGVELGPRLVAVEDAHGVKATPTARVHSLDWVTATNTIKFKPYGESAFGPGVVLSATNDHRVPLYNADGTKWIFVTVTFATIDAHADLTSDGTDAKGLKITPSLENTGFSTLAHPTYRRFGNLSTSDPTAGGDALTVKSLRWLARTVMDAQGVNSGTGFIVADPDMYSRIEDVLDAAGSAEPIDTFMGSSLNARGISGVPIFRSLSANETRVAADGSTAVGRIFGIVYGNENSNAHFRYNTVANLAAVSAMPDSMAGGIVDTGHFSGPTAMPFTYYVVPPNTANEQLIPRASMYVEGAAARFDSVSWLDCIKYTA